MTVAKLKKFPFTLFGKFENPDTENEYVETFCTLEGAVPAEEGVIEVAEYRLVRQFKAKSKVKVQKF